MSEPQGRLRCFSVSVVRSTDRVTACQGQRELSAVTGAARRRAACHLLKLGLRPAYKYQGPNKLAGQLCVARLSSTHLEKQHRSQNMSEISNEPPDQTAEQDGLAGWTHLGTTTTSRKAVLALLLTCMCAPIVTGQQHQLRRLWPPENIEPCLMQCPGQHVQMTDNRSSETVMSDWGAQPIFDFMSNGQWQTAGSALLPTALPFDVAAASSLTTLVTSVTAVTSPTGSQSTSHLPMSRAERILACNAVCQAFIALSCVAVVQ